MSSGTSTRAYATFHIRIRLVDRTEQSYAADDTIGWCNCGPEVDCCNTVASGWLCVDRTLVTRRIIVD